MLPNNAQEAKTQGKTVIELSNGETTLYFKLPTGAEIAMFQDQLMTKEGGSQSLLQEKFLRSLYVGDDAVAFDALLREKPLIVHPILHKLCNRLGAGENFTLTEA